MKYFKPSVLTCWCFSAAFTSILHQVWCCTVEGPKQEDAAYGLECWQHDQRGRLLVVSHLDVAASDVYLYGSPKKPAGESSDMLRWKVRGAGACRHWDVTSSWCGDYVTELKVHTFLSLQLYVKTIHTSVARPCMIPVGCVSQTECSLLYKGLGSERLYTEMLIVSCFLYIACPVHNKHVTVIQLIVLLNDTLIVR